MSNTVNNNIPFVPENTIDPAAGLNESLNIIDMMLQLAVLSVNANTPPASPAEGDRHIIGTAPTGAWAGWPGFLARYLDGYWRFLPARLAFNLADGVLYGRRTTTWTSVAGSGGVAWGSITGTLSAQTDLANALAGKVATTQLGANSGVATLDAAGKIPVSQLPPLAVNEVFTVASQAAMLALTAERGDVAIRTDQEGRAYILSADAPGTLANWISLDQALSVALAALNVLTPAADRLPYFDSTSTAALAVFTAQARTLLAAATQAAQKAVLGFELVDNTPDLSKPVSGPQQAALDGKVSLTTSETIGGNKTFTGNTSLMQTGGTSSLELAMTIYSENVNAIPSMVLRHSNGTQASPLPLTSGQRLGAFLFSGQTSPTANGNLCGFNVYAAEDFSPTGSGTYFEFANTRAGQTGRSTVYQVNENNNFLLGVSRAGASGDKLDVGGSGKFTGPLKPGLYTMATRPTASAWTGYIITVSDPAGGLQQQHSAGGIWAPINAGGWTSLTLVSGFTAGPTAPQYRIIDDVVEFRGKVTIAAALGMNTLRQFATMPTGYRPTWLVSDTDPLRLPICNVTSGVGGVYLNALRTGVFSLAANMGLAANDVIDLSNIRYSLA